MIITRRVSSLALSLAVDDDSRPEPRNKNNVAVSSSLLSSSSSRSSPNQTSAALSRQVSNDGLASISDSEETDKEDYSSLASTSSGRTSPIRCVSEFDKAVEACLADGAAPKKNKSCGHYHTTRPAPTSTTAATSSPLFNPTFLQCHTRALRLEAALQPLRLILSRLMYHPTLNRKGIFNSPVDPVALGLPDYFDVIRHPMDLGLVKVKLHAIGYLSRSAVANDIRLVFSNAMTYNPPHHPVHVAARDLLAFFEEQLAAFAPELCCLVDPTPAAIATATATTITGLPLTVNPPVHTTSTSIPPTVLTSQGTRHSATIVTAPGHHAMVIKRRKKRGSKVEVGHACHSCLGRACHICHQGCLPLEPTMLICNGPACAGARIRKGGVYFVTPDGSRHFCQRCHVGLPAVLPSLHGGSHDHNNDNNNGDGGGHADSVRHYYKRDLLKRKNDEELVERWLSCGACGTAVHRMCALHDEYAQSDADYRCPDCTVAGEGIHASFSDADAPEDDNLLYTFVSGSDAPAKLVDVTGKSGSGAFTAENLPATEVSAFMERRVRERMKCDQCPNAERTLLVRVISDCDRCFKVPDVVRNHFRMAPRDTNSGVFLPPPSAVHYRSKAIALFQKIDGLDVCIFCMYVHEYNGEDSSGAVAVAQKKRVYIAYIDSVEHFRPRTSRTSVYHEMLVAYLATARKRGFETAHIWSCPPSRGNCFVFWNHPCSQRTPNPERLEAWYHAALNRAVECGVVSDIQSLYETDFQRQLEPETSTAQRLGFLHCPPLLDGDFWIEEAVRVHALNMTRQLRSKVEECEAAPLSVLGSGCVDRCPARQVAALLRDVVLPHPSSLPFRRPVNAAAMKLTDYHKVITKPMDLGTVYSRCVLGEYPSLADLVSDVELVIANAKTYNPKGHIVHVKADEVREIFFVELNRLVESWLMPFKPEEPPRSWEDVASISLSLDLVFETFPEPIAVADKSDMLSSKLRLKFDESLLESDGNEVEPTSCCIKPYDGSLVGGGPEFIHQRMVGKDTWVLEKNPTPAKDVVSSQRGHRRRRKGLGDLESEPPAKRRRQAWLGIEVGAAVRRMRTSFFNCSLTPKQLLPEEQGKMRCFELYAFDFDPSLCEEEACVSTVADMRHSLLELSQFRNLEFDTLRHAKYSTAVLLYHFHNGDAAGAIPICSSCKGEIKEVRWHKLVKVVDFGRHKSLIPASGSTVSEELCGDCFKSKENGAEHFTPLQVSMLGS